MRVVTIGSGWDSAAASVGGSRGSGAISNAGSAATSGSGTGSGSGVGAGEATLDSASLRKVGLKSFQRRTSRGAMPRCLAASAGDAPSARRVAAACWVGVRAGCLLVGGIGVDFQAVAEDGAAGGIAGE